jgi:hypothetical protein
MRRQYSDSVMCTGIIWLRIVPSGWVLVKLVMLFPYKMMIFLTNWAIISFPKRTLFHGLSWRLRPCNKQQVQLKNKHCMQSIVFVSSLCARHQTDSGAYSGECCQIAIRLWQDKSQPLQRKQLRIAERDSCVSFIIVHNVLSIIIFIPLIIFFTSLVVHTCVPHMKLCGNGPLVCVPRRWSDSSVVMRKCLFVSAAL